MESNIYDYNSFVKELDLYVFEEVCKDLQRFHREGRVHEKISVQLSGRLFRDAGLGQRLQEIMEPSGASGRRSLSEIL